MINGGKLIGKSSPLGESGRLSRASRGEPNDVAAKQSMEGISRNSAIYAEQTPNTSQLDNPIHARLSSPQSNRGAAGYEGGRSTYIEMDNTGYSQLAKNKPAARSSAPVRTTSNVDTSGMLPMLFGPRSSTISDYRSFKGNLDR